MLYIHLYMKQEGLDGPVSLIWIMLDIELPIEF